MTKMSTGRQIEDLYSRYIAARWAARTGAYGPGAAPAAERLRDRIDRALSAL